MRLDIRSGSPSGVRQRPHVLSNPPPHCIRSISRPCLVSKPNLRSFARKTISIQRASLKVARAWLGRSRINSEPVLIVTSAIGTG